jgi:hypothetical protein
MSKFFMETYADVVLTTGLGLSDKGVPLRLPAVLLTGLSLLQTFVKQGQRARYVVYQATDFITEVNKLDPVKAQNCSEQTANYLDQFVGRFFPELVQLVTIKTGADCVVRRMHLIDAEQSLHDLARKDDPKINAALDTICSYGHQHKGSDAYIRYAAANVLLNGGYAKHYPLFDFSGAANAVVMPLGGQKEAPFFSLTSAMASFTGCLHRVEPQIVPTGKIPTYYPCRDGDLLL